MSNVISAVFKENGSNIVYTKKMSQHDKGIILRLSGIALPETYQVQFSDGDRSAISVSRMVSGSDIRIPDALFQMGKYIYVWIYLSQDEEGTEDSSVGVSAYTVIIPVMPKPVAIDMESGSGQVVADLDEENHTLIFRTI